MNYFDAIILILLAWAAYRGFVKGLVVMVAAFAALIIGIWGAVKFSGLVANWLVYTLNASSPYMELVSFTITFIGIVIGINIAAFLFSKFLDAIALGFFNRILGSLFGILKMTLIVSVLLVLLNAFNERHDFLPEEQVGSSLFYRPVSEIAPRIFPFLRFENLARELEKLIG